MEGCNRKCVKNAPSRASFSKNLFRYIAATSHQKILRRLNQRLSRPFTDSLIKVKAEKIPIPSRSSGIAPLLDEQSDAFDKDELKNDSLSLGPQVGHFLI